jgi:hypothetical protein
VVEKQNSDGFPADAWNQTPFYGFLSYQTYGPAAPAFRWVTANHGDDSLFLAVVEHGGCAGTLLFLECRFQAALSVTVPYLANGLRRQRHHLGNLWSTGALGQLEQCQGT